MHPAVARDQGTASRDPKRCAQSADHRRTPQACTQLIIFPPEVIMKFCIFFPAKKFATSTVPLSTPPESKEGTI